MSKTRSSIFGDEATTTLDLGSFAPKAAPDVKAPPAEQVRAVAQASNFHSREPVTTKPATKKTRASRQYRTGRNVQFNVKALAETVDAFYAITEEQKGWVLGYTLQRAVEALQRELKKPK
jgi:hypothetical protein